MRARPRLRPQRSMRPELAAADSIQAASHGRPHAPARVAFDSRA